MNINAFSTLVDLSPHTLRYYEKIGLLKNIHRTSSGNRTYTSKDLKWITFVKRLKETAMPLEDILKYARLREIGTNTVLQRQKLLEQHQENLKIHIAQQQAHLTALEDKINLYKNGNIN